MFFAQFMIEAGVFFTVPLFLSVVLELNALQTVARLTVERHQELSGRQCHQDERGPRPSTRPSAWLHT